jgi:hypothetical protein
MTKEKEKALADKAAREARIKEMDRQTWKDYAKHLRKEQRERKRRGY